VAPALVPGGVRTGEVLLDAVLVGLRLRLRLSGGLELVGARGGQALHLLRLRARAAPAPVSGRTPRCSLPR
jgi:hypothetical protein